MKNVWYYDESTNSLREFMRAHQVNCPRMLHIFGTTNTGLAQKPDQIWKLVAPVYDDM